MLTAEAFIPLKHYATLIQWCTARAWPAPDPRMLPPTGVVISARGKPIVSGFLFKTDAKIATISGILSDPDSDKQVRGDALDYLIMALADLGREAGFILISGGTNIPTLQARYKRLGFMETDVGVSHFGRTF
jgi:hypothetical protein